MQQKLIQIILVQHEHINCYAAARTRTNDMEQKWQNDTLNLRPLRTYVLRV